MAKDRSKQPETVYTTVQRERSRPFKERLKIFAKDERRKQIPISRSYVGQKGLSFREKLKRVGQYASDSSGRKIAGGLSMLRRGAVTRKLYGQPFSPYGSNIKNIPIGQRTGRRGRPKGSVDPRYAKYGGVYGYRKALAQARWREKQEILQRSVTNPSQLARLRQIQAQDQMRMQSPEAQTFPNTYGKVPTKSIFQEIDDASNIFP